MVRELWNCKKMYRFIENLHLSLSLSLSLSLKSCFGVDNVGLHSQCVSYNYKFMHIRVFCTLLTLPSNDRHVCLNRLAGGPLAIYNVYLLVGPRPLSLRIRPPPPKHLVPPIIEIRPAANPPEIKLRSPPNF